MSALEQGFRIVDAIVAAGRDGLPFTAIVETTGVPKASAHRLLKQLESLSAIRYDATTRRYTGGLVLAQLGSAVLADYDLRRTAHPHLVALHDDTGFVATLGMLNDDSGIYLDKIEGSDFGIRLHSEIGKTFPLHCTAMGKVLLATAGPTLVRRIANRKLEAYTANTITSADELRAELADVLRNGYAIDREEITRGLMCVAAPVVGARGETAGAMSCTFPSYVAEEAGLDAAVRAVVRHAGAASGHRGM